MKCPSENHLSNCMKKIKLIIVDDHQIVIDGLLSLLEGHSRFEVVGTTTDPAKVLSLLDANNADILLTDVMMPGMNGAELAKLGGRNSPIPKYSLFP